MKKILFLDAYFHPEIIAYTHLEKDIISGLLEKFKVSVICPTPTRGITDETAREYAKIKKETLPDGVEIKRFSCPREGRNPLIRAFRYFWCGARHCAVGKQETDADAVFAVSTPPTQGAVAAMVAKRLSKKKGARVPFIYNLQDIFPDSLVTTGLAREGSVLWKLGRKLEDYTYKNADKIIVISEGFKKNIMKKGVPEEKITVVSNWIDTDAVRPVPRSENTVFDEFSIPRDRFTVVYAGNFGAAQGADVVIEAAERLAERSDIQFVIFGGGSEFESVRASVEEKKLSNVFIHGLLPQDRVPEVYSAGDVALITCKKGVGGSGMPSKTWSIMACGTPIIAAFDTDSELAETITQAGAGISVEPEDAELLASAILRMAEGEAERYSGGREYAIEHASREKCVRKYVEAFEIGDRVDNRQKKAVGTESYIDDPTV
ncbi:MAG: glycosyltransferase family 4 protein [Clostridia bacterium]|nr:glycosyltransferase family 4 protein [Clostridia bacterium]